jgi:hypothetical protein
MRIRKQQSLFVVGPPLLALCAALPADADVNYQCPDPLLTQKGSTCGNNHHQTCTFNPSTPSASTDPDCKDPTSASFANCKVLIDPVTGQASGATTDPNVVCRAITCGDGHVNMADGNDIYIFGFSDVTNAAESQILTRGNPVTPDGIPLGGAQFSAPTMFAKEGQTLYLTLTNTGFRERPDLFDPHTVHYHGFPNAASVFDGEPMASFGINLGSSLTYYYNNQYPGTYMYHCHVEASEHMQMGMLGNLYILPKQDGTSHHGYSKFAYDDCGGTCSATTSLSCLTNSDCPSHETCSGNNLANLCGSTGYNVLYFLQETGFDPEFHDADHSYNKISFSDMNDTYLMLNGRGYPDTVDPNPIINVNDNPSQPMPAIPFAINSDGSRSPLAIPHGQKLLLRISSLNTVDFSTVTVLGIPMRIVGQGAQLLRGQTDTQHLTGLNTSYATGSFTLGGGEAVDVLLDTTNVAPGTYFLYTTNLNHLSNNTEDFGGMMTEILVN